MAFFGLIKGKKLTTDEMVILTTSLSYMLSAGLTLRDGVGIIIADPDNKMRKEGLQTLMDGFDEGLVLSQVLQQHEDVFGEGLWQQIDAAERTGKVPQALLRISEQLKSNKGVVSKIKGAMAYPTIVIVIAVLAAIYLFTNTIPEMGQMMADLGGEMPALTLAMMAFANLLINHGIVIGIVVAVIVVAIQWSLTHPLRKNWHQFITKSPLAGGISINLSYSRFYLMVNDMIENGSPTVDAIRVAATTIDNLFVKDELRSCADVMEREGYGIAEALHSATSMPSDDKLMLGVGAKTGREMEILQDLAKRRAAAANQAVERLLEMMTPIIMIFVCAIVAVLVVSVYLPMLTMASTMG